MAAKRTTSLSSTGPKLYAVRASGIARPVGTSSPSMRDLARTLQAASRRTSRSDAPAAELVNANLRLSLTRFAGTGGFASLLRRALALASTTMPVLQSAKVGPEGNVEGLDPVVTQDDVVWQEATVAVTTQLLELLVIFIGEPLARRMVREACPDLSSEE